MPQTPECQCTDGGSRRDIQCQVFDLMQSLAHESRTAQLIITTDLGSSPSTAKRSRSCARDASWNSTARQVSSRARSIPFHVSCSTPFVPEEACAPGSD